MINITCPCLYPLIVTVTDDDGDKTTYWAMPDDELDNEKFKIPEINNIIENGKEYVAIIWENPKDENGNVIADIKRYEVNNHFMFAGCNFGDKLKKGGKMVCREKELYIVLHPKLEWENYHIRELKS